uniref:Nuclear RNA export factor 1 n=1 Tax=Ditylenchus dipsaci TaxID=166011 RepID=A0A915DW90_9BILA
MDRLNIDGRATKGRVPYKPRDVKARTMRNFTVYDEDVASRYEDYEDEEPVPLRSVGGPSSSKGGPAATIMRAIGGRIQQNARRDQHAQRVGGGSSRREIISLVTVRGAARSGKETVLKLLADSISNFHPIAPKINGGNIEFYLKNSEDAEAAKSMSRRLADRKNPSVKFNITANRCAAPWEPLLHPMKQLIEDVVLKRYSPVSNSLDLSDFANEKNFTDANVHCPLFNNAIMVHVADVISSHLGSIQGLSIKGNRLRSLDFVATLVYVAPKVVELDLSSNALTRIEELDRIRGWHIEKLHLENNELVSRFNDGSSYSSAIHEYFPRVNYLDGIFVNRTPFSLADNDEDATDALLPYRPGYYPDENMRSHVENFLLEYLNLYDGPNGEESRKRLMNAYDDHATFTFAVHTLQDFSCRVPRGDSEAYTNYIRSSHNLLHEGKWSNYRDKIVFKGSMDVAVALSKLPLTSHVKDSFVIDFNLVTSNLVVFTFQGILRDGEDAFKSNGDCKFFMRNFVVIPKADNTMAILSDMLSLSPISTERLTRYNELLKKASESQSQPQAIPSTSIAYPASSNGNLQMASQGNLFGNQMEVSLGQNSINGGAIAPPPPAPTPQPVLQNMQNQNVAAEPPVGVTSPVYDVNDPLIQQAMIKQFSEISRMKPEWSQKCLADMNWDFEAAGKVFNDIRANIPKEAFET